MTVFRNITKRAFVTAFAFAYFACQAFAAEITVETEPESGMKYRAILTERESESENEITLHDSGYSPYFDFPSLSIFSEYTEKERAICEGDIYVSSTGDDAGDGTFESPYRTIERARDEIRNRRMSGTLPEGGITVSVMAGTYRLTSGITFESVDGGTADCPVTYTAYGDGEVILSGAIELSSADFSSPEGAIGSRLSDEAKQHVVMTDLKKYGVTADMITLNQTGQATMRGTNVELSVDRETFVLARYPNDSFLFSDGIVNSSGRARLTMTDEAIDHVNTWNSTDDVWALGIINTDYQDSTSAVSVDTDSGILTFNDADTNGYKQNMPYYFFNVPEELDSAGEWYLDREDCILYMYPYDDDISNSSIELAVSFYDTMIT